MDVLESLERISGIKPNTVFEEKTKGDVKDTWADTSKAKELLGYHPKTSLDEGLSQEFEWAKEWYG
jgi:UDP-glucose 4-epimerase